MDTRKRLIRMAVALVFSLVGSGTIFSFVVWMNASVDYKKEEEPRKEIEMTAAPKKKPPKKRKQRVTPKQRRQPMKSAPAPAPNLSSAISGLSFGLPGFSVSSLDDAQNRALGDAEAMRGMVMTADSVDEKPRPVQKVPAKYPPRARAKGITGSVRMSILIGVDGSVEHVKVLSAEPPGVFEDSAVEAAKMWKFAPATYKGERVKVWATVPFNFNLS